MVEQTQQKMVLAMKAWRIYRISLCVKGRDVATTMGAISSGSLERTLWEANAQFSVLMSPRRHATKSPEKTRSSLWVRRFCHFSFQFHSAIQLSNRIKATNPIAKWDKGRDTTRAMVPNR